MYIVKENQIYYRHPDRKPELFITVHRTAESKLTSEQQARIIAAMLNGTVTPK